MRFMNRVTSPRKDQGIRRAVGNQRLLPTMLLCLATASCGGPTRPVGVVGHVEGFAGLVASDEPRASLVGRDVLSAGGSPADAAVAMAFTLAVTLPAQAGLGGGGACLIYDHDTKKVEELNFVAPPPNELEAETTRPSALPALPRGMFSLHAKYGRLRWEQLLAPAEAYARLGTPVSRAFANQLVPVSDALFQDAGAKRIFAKADGQPVVEGDQLVQMDLGATLSRLRQKGVGEFYTGPWAKDVVAAVTAAGGSLTIEQLNAYQPQWRAPLAVGYGDDTAYFPQPPASAGMFEAELWSLLAANGSYAATPAALRPHLLAETFADAFADRARWLNPEGTANQGSKEVLSKAHLASVMAGYNAATHQAAGGDAPADTVAGTGFVAVDKDGSAAVCTLSMNNSFGTGRVAPGTGILLAAAAGVKGRGPHAVGPMLAINTNSNEFRLGVAAGGGPAAPTALVQTALVAVIDGKPLVEAQSAKRLHAANEPDAVAVEPGTPGEAGLQARNHKVVETELPGRVNIDRCTSGSPTPARCTVATDPRGSGMSVQIGSGS
jgi:gamma-glutamyltranspeptidase/glutathione hydrolase